MSDLLLIFGLGFLGSFGHCASMCGPLTVAFSLTASSHSATSKASTQASTEASAQAFPEASPNASTEASPNGGEPKATVPKTTIPKTTVPKATVPDDSTVLSRWQQVRFHLLLNIGRLISYGVVGLLLGTLGAMVVWSGQLAGVGSDLRRAIAILTGLLLIWFGLRQVCPTLLPRIPLQGSVQARLHHQVERVMGRVSSASRLWSPLLLGMAWGLMPCGFLFAAQIKATGQSDPLMGALTMGAFGLGTLPTMVGIGVVSSLLSQNRRSQLFRAGGWVAIAIGSITLLRTGDLMVDYTGYGALVCLILALIARPIARLWAAPMQYRRALGVGAFVLSVAHVVHRLEHTWNWNPNALFFMPPAYQQGIVLGLVGLVLLTPPALTSFDGAQRSLGQRWRSLHLLSVPALVLVAVHSIMVGSSFLGTLQPSSRNYALTSILCLAVAGTLLGRSPLFWSLLSLRRFYTPFRSVSSTSSASTPSTSCHDTPIASTSSTSSTSSASSASSERTASAARPRSPD